ncbi:hypothetical protein OG533_39590 (plasmid) [Streptomyces sp. NBC_01186]|nr:MULTISPECIES: hypothetical protein [unclassified Streptomyces]WSB82014.1 hypothetical protein OHB04_40485 [Streptomyces sp. NBC_01775]WSS17989.1 hypothetical protein OG533_39590 [Streptomyces sp. NBC_01186]
MQRHRPTVRPVLAIPPEMRLDTFVRRLHGILARSAVASSRLA